MLRLRFFLGEGGEEEQSHIECFYGYRYVKNAQVHFT